MVSPDLYTNAPFFTEHTHSSGYQEVWYLKCNAPQGVHALWLRFTILIRKDRSKEIAETWAIFFDRTSGTTIKVGLKNTFPLALFQRRGIEGIQIKDSFLSPDKTVGFVSSKQGHIRWDFSLTPKNHAAHDFVPTVLHRLGLVKNIAWTVYENLLFSGSCEVNGVRYSWENAPGMQGHLAGPKNGHSWAWGHCNSFLDETGTPAPVVWDGLSARARLGHYAAPPLTSMFLQVGEHQFSLNRVRDALRARSSFGFHGWTFDVSQGDFRFQGHLTARMEDFAGVTYEDTDGSFLYCHNAKICPMTLDITHAAAKTQRYTAMNTAAYEVVTRAIHPEIEILI